MIFAAAADKLGLVQQILNYTVAGLATAAIYAIAASGLVVTYTTSGIFNFAHGAFGMMAAFLYWQLGAKSSDGGWGLGYGWAFVLVVFVIAPLFGALVERVVMRNLRGTSEMLRVAVTVGLMLALLALAPVIWAPDEARDVPDLISGRVRIFDVGVSYHRILTVVIALVVALVLRLLLFGTRFGTAMRAVVDDPDLAGLNGIAPQRVSSASWALGSSLAALSGVLIVSQVALSAVGLTLLVVNAFAAAVFGRLQSLQRAFVGAVVLGLAEAYVIGFVRTDDTSALGRAVGRFEGTGWSVANLQPAMPAIVLFVVMFFSTDTRSRSHAIERVRGRIRVPRWPSALFGALALVVVTAAIGSLLSTGDQLSVADGLLLALVVLSLVPLTGFSGQMCMAQMTFFGIGVLAMGHFGPTNIGLGVAAAVAISAAAGVLVALPALRLRGIYLALLTAAFATLTLNLIFKQQVMMPNQSLTVPPLAHVVNTPFGRLMELSVAFALIALLIVAVRRSALGRRMVALSDAPDACSTMGLNAVGTKLTAFAISAAIAGFAGAISGQIYQADSFGLESSLAVLLFSVVGGVGSVAGALIGGLLLGTFQSILNGLFATTRFGFFSVWSVSVTDLMRLGPGLMGMNLGSNPAGIASQVDEGLEPLERRPSLFAALLGGAAVLWCATKYDVISHWGFFAGLTVWLTAAAPLLAPLARRRPPGEGRTGTTDVRGGPYAVPAFVAGAVLTLVAAFIPWDTAFSSNGWRFVLIVAMAALGAAALMSLAVADPEHDVRDDANDVALGRRLTTSEVLDADRALDLVGVLGGGSE